VRARDLEIAGETDHPLYVILLFLEICIAKKLPPLLRYAEADRQLSLLRSPRNCGKTIDFSTESTILFSYEAMTQGA
jgi:hypothetical protein